MKNPNFKISPPELYEPDELAAQLGVECEKCFDTGTFVISIKETRPCECRTKKQAARLFQRAVSCAPEQWQWLTNGFASIRSNKRAVERFALIEGFVDGAKIGSGEGLLDRIEKRRENSFYIWGKTGVYKTTIALALLQEAGRRGRLTAYGLGREFIDTLRTYSLKQTAPESALFYSLDQFAEGRPYSLMIDEIEDTASGLTSYTLSTIFRLVEKAQAHNQQLIITSNRSLDDLLDFWTNRDNRFLKGEADAENYCAKIDRRLQEICTVLELR